MTLSLDDREQIKDQLSAQEKYLVEKLSGDRKTHAIHFRSIDHELTVIKNHQEIMLLKIEQLAELVKTDKCSTCQNGKDLKTYKEKMYPYEFLMNYKRIPFYTASVLFLMLIWNKLPFVWNIVKSKILGL